MPTFMAVIIATTLAWIVEHASFSMGSVPVKALLGLIVWLVAFYFAKRFLSLLRPGD